MRTSTLRALVPTLLAAFFLGGLPATGHASLISVDWQADGDGLLTLDQATGLRWLDLSVTDIGWSYDQMVAQLQPGGTFAEFRYATAPEFLELMTSAAIQPSGLPNAFVAITENFAPVTAFQALFGITDDPIGGYNLNDTFGVTSTPAIEKGWLTAANVRRFLWGPYAGGAAGPYAGEAGFFLTPRGPDATGQNLAHWLVQASPVPIPPAVWLFGSALGVMGVMRRRS